MDMNKQANTDNNESFAIVPRALTTSGKFDATDKLILTHLLERYQITRYDGHPYTFSVAGIAKDTALSEKTVRRHTRKLTGYKILNRYGTMRNEKTLYPVYAFDRVALNGVILTTDKLSLDIAPQTLNEMQSDNLTRDKLSFDTTITRDKLSDKMPSKSNKIKGTSKIVKETKESTSTGNPDLKALEDFFCNVPEISRGSIQGSGSVSLNENKECVGVGCSLQGSATNTENNGVFISGNSKVGMVSSVPSIQAATSGNKNSNNKVGMVSMGLDALLAPKGDISTNQGIVKGGLSVSAPAHPRFRSKSFFGKCESRSVNSYKKDFWSLPQTKQSEIEEYIVAEYKAPIPDDKFMTEYPANVV